jgi:hypothetical protein
MFMEAVDSRIRALAGPELAYDDVMTDFLRNSRDEFLARYRPAGLLEYADLGRDVPWLWRLTLHTRGLVRDEAGTIQVVERHVVAVRFLPDYLRQVNRFQTLCLVEPANAFHPNLAPPAICLEVYPGEPLVEIVDALHRLLGWRLRQLSESDALNKDACAWGRAHVDELPIDARPLFGRNIRIQLDAVEETA